MQKKYVFFLGGHDAEMLAIREILETNSVPFFDKNLTWGATLSIYKEELARIPEDKTPVLVELRLDSEYPARAIIIDHHNDRAGKYQKTSLEQTAELLGITLNRRQRLISANDRGHIPAMRELGATLEEMQEIRIYDRRCQGVTDEDERLAEESIQKRSEPLGNQAIYINSLTEKSSPVMDRIYDKFRHIFIITPSNDLSYFGTGDMIEKLELLYKKLQYIDPRIIYWKGGNLPDTGFFGSVHAINKNEIKKLLT